VRGMGWVKGRGGEGEEVEFGGRRGGLEGKGDLRAAEGSGVGKRGG